MFIIFLSKLVSPKQFEVVAFMFLLLLILATLTLKSRMITKPKALVISEFITPFRQIAYLLVTMAASLFLFGMFFPLSGLFV